MIADYIAQAIAKEEEGRSRTNPVRMSSAGKCARAMAYQLHGYEAEPLPPRALMVFRLGDTIEKEVKALIQKYCPPEYVIEYPDITLKVPIAGKEVTGHIDGIIRQPVPAILEIKSINTMRFKFLEKDGIPYEYQCQATAYMKALEIPRTVFIFYNKDTSHLMQFTYEFSQQTWEEVEKRFASVIESTKERLPEREYEANEKGKLPWQCSYCSYNRYCWPEAETIFEKGKPKLILKQTA